MVGINLDTMNDMKEQFEEKERKYLKIFKKLTKQADSLNNSIDDIIETLEIQTVVLKKLFNKLDDYSDYDDEIKDLVMLIDTSSKVGLLNYHTEQKWNLYKVAQDMTKTIEEEETILSLSVNKD